MVFSSFAPIAACVLGLSGVAAPQLPASTLQLSLHETTGRLSSVSLTCDPAGGSHPESDAACATLTGVDGDIAHIKPRLQRCTMIYSPVDAAAFGTWHGKPVTFHATFSNKCAADAQTAGVFGF
ncbi:MULTISPECIES: SSI family serine proteinase inhibitor [unclassified Amycolatopsis]|uniref:SSI family serine proteinase inhibitor n=1 Tax=unclassified Amycolatopsis TaxID=2618356 RepID=UPI001C69FD75|nr:SSI family serine proteinase inhibitor [Amycolatopsis sp. DSM 110486]QYN21565.1 subtilase-type protease inhibitor [Amycolatopsis sp. DSM 110486]